MSYDKTHKFYSIFKIPQYVLVFTNLNIEKYEILNSNN